VKETESERAREWEKEKTKEQRVREQERERERITESFCSGRCGNQWKTTKWEQAKGIFSELATIRESVPQEEGKHFIVDKGRILGNLKLEAVGIRMM
jgi:hypothetical protein